MEGIDDTECTGTNTEQQDDNPDNFEASSELNEECEMLRAQLVLLNTQLYEQRKVMMSERHQTGNTSGWQCREDFWEGCKMKAALTMSTCSIVFWSDGL